MAKMYPKEFSKDTKSNAEKLLFEQFREHLPDEYSVFHHVSLLGRRSRKYDKHGEIDFVIVHPALGVLVLEVKGGLISVEDGCWFSTDKGGAKHKIDRSPFDQVEDNKFDLIREIKADQRTEKYQGFYRIRHGVAMPDSIVKGQNFGMNAPREIIVDANDLWDLPAAVRRVVGTPEKGYTIPKDALTALKDLLKPTRESARGLSAEILLANGKIIELTEEQYRHLDFLQDEPRALIHGCAGSGKTMLAMEKARRLAAEGAQVLFTCFNVDLANWVREQFQRDTNASSRNITVAHYHGLARELCNKAGVILPKKPNRKDEQEQYYDKEMPEKLYLALANVPERFGAIVADEGQDISKAWWDAIKELLEDPENGAFYIFYDDNQRIYQRQSGFPFNRPLCHLSINCRNTDRIHRRVVQYYQSSPKPKPAGVIEGLEPEILRDAATALDNALKNVFKRLFTDERIPADQVVILTPIRQNSALTEGKKIGNLKLTWNKQPSPNEVRVCTIHSFKGLESPVVILAELDRTFKEQQDKLLYIATSRAKSRLIVLGELPEPVTQPPSGQTEPDLDGTERVSEDIVVESAIAADPTAPPTTDDVITSVIAPEVAAEPVAVSEVIEAGSPSSSDVIAVPVAPMEADTAISVAATATGVPEAGSSSTEPRLSPPSPRIGRAPVRRRRVAVRVESRPSPPSPRIGRGGQGVRADGNDDRIPAPLALPAPTPTNAVPSVQEPVDRVVPVRHQTPPPPPPGAPRPSWTSQVDDSRQWSVPRAERAQPPASTPPPTSTPPSSGVGGARKPPKAEGGKSAPPEPPRKGSTVPTEPSGNGWAVAGLLCGILALFIHILAIAAIIAAAIGLSKTREHGGRGKSAGWIGLALGVIVVLGMLQ